MSAVVVAPPVQRTTRSRAATREVWLDRVARFPASGLTVAQFCAIEEVSAPLLTPGNAACPPRRTPPPRHRTKGLSANPVGAGPGAPLARPQQADQRLGPGDP